MARSLIRFGFALSLMSVAGCFNPDIPELPSAEDERDADELDAGDDANGDVAVGGQCIEIDEPCERNDACCEFDPELPVGASACVAIDGAASCASICLEADDCSSGCCVQLDGVAYGACLPASACG